MFLVDSLRVTERMAKWKKYTALPKCSPQDIFKNFYRKCKNETKMAEESSNERSIKQIGLKKKIRKQSTFPVNKIVKQIYYDRQKNQGTNLG